MVLVYYITSTYRKAKTVLNLDEQSGVPFYLQVVRQIRRQIIAGAIRPGDQLPAVRDMARDLVLNPNTIAKAYQELERDTFACAPSSPMTESERRSTISGLLKKVLLEAALIAVSTEEVAALLTQLIEERDEQRIAT
jgi:GntR family transcriptional regulator